MKMACEYIRGLRYKLRMMGINLMEKASYNSDKSVLCDTGSPDLRLKNKLTSVAYQIVQEGCARDEWRTAYIITDTMLPMSKPLPAR